VSSVGAVATIVGAMYSTQAVPGNPRPTRHREKRSDAAGPIHGTLKMSASSSPCSADVSGSCKACPQTFAYKAS
jgi:hypothetical protein